MPRDPRYDVLFESVAPGGIPFAASCSHNVDPPSFAEAVARGLVDAGREGRIVCAAPDYPRHPALPETDDLKSLTLQLD